MLKSQLKEIKDGLDKKNAGLVRDFLDDCKRYDLAPAELETNLNGTSKSRAERYDRAIKKLEQQLECPRARVHELVGWSFS